MAIFQYKYILLLFRNNCTTDFENAIVLIESCVHVVPPRPHTHTFTYTAYACQISINSIGSHVNKFSYLRHVVLLVKARLAIEFYETGWSRIDLAF